jgi:hypothetical protein
MTALLRGDVVRYQGAGPNMLVLIPMMAGGMTAVTFCGERGPATEVESFPTRLLVKVLGHQAFNDASPGCVQTTDEASEMADRS